MNDESKSEAKENIENVLSSYDLSFYDPIYINVDVEPVLKRVGAVHHAAAINNGMEIILEDYKSKLSNSELFLFEEFDVIHKRNFYSSLKQLYDFSKQFDSFFGRVRPGNVVISENHFHQRDYSLNPENTFGNIETKDGDLFLWMPRILPHFLGFHSGLIDDFFSTDCGFLSKVGNFVSYYSSEKTSSDITVYNDTGTDLFKDIFHRRNFFHMNDIPSIHHLKGV